MSECERGNGSAIVCVRGCVLFRVRVGVKKDVWEMVCDWVLCDSY